MKSLQVSIVDFRSQYTDLIGKSLRDLGVRSVILQPEKAEKWFAQNRPKAVILSGSDFSVNDADAPDIPDAILNAGVPILGLCFGMQVLAKTFGGLRASSVEPNHRGIAAVATTQG